jgi:hypothetical protein
MGRHWDKIITVKFTYREDECEADVIVKMYNDPNYGADADGNRGMSMDFVDEVIVIEARTLKGDVLNITKELEDIVTNLNLSTFDLSE